MGILRDLYRWARGHRDERVPVAPPPQRLVFGLGNPGPKYEATRHNVGFRVVECLAARADLPWIVDRALDARVCHVELAGIAHALIEPLTFMNRSGRSVEAALARWPEIDPARDLIVVFDDMDLPTGRIRLRPSGGAGGHRGMGDILDALDSKNVDRLRFGVGHPGDAAGVLDWVLAPFDEDEEAELEVAIEWAADAIVAVAADGLKPAMGRFNAARPESGSGAG